MGKWGITPLILNLRSEWRCQLHIPAHLPAVKGLDAGWASEEVWLLWRKEKSPAPCRNQTVILWILGHSLVIVQTEEFWLLLHM